MAPAKQASVEFKPMDSSTLTNMKTSSTNKGAWTAEEDKKLAEVIAIHGARRWKAIAAKAGLNRCGKSCRLRWMNYLRPNIKRGNISDQEEDLILRLHKLLGNRWSLIAGRLPGRTDNEIKNYWNSHLSKKIKQKEKQSRGSCRDKESKAEERTTEKKVDKEVKEESSTSNNKNEDSDSLKFLNNSRGSESAEGVDLEGSNNVINFNVDDFFDFSNEDPLKLEWLSPFLEMDHHESLNIGTLWNN